MSNTFVPAILDLNDVDESLRHKKPRGSSYNNFSSSSSAMLTAADRYKGLYDSAYPRRAARKNLRAARAGSKRGRIWEDGSTLIGYGKYRRYRNPRTRSGYKRFRRYRLRNRRYVRGIVLI